MCSQMEGRLKNQALPVAIRDLEVSVNWEVESFESWGDDINFTGRGTKLTPEESTFPFQPSCQPISQQSV